MNVYKVLKLVSGNSLPPSLKLFGLWGMHIAGRRTLGVFLDPVLACNLRCRMCYFSDPDKRAAMRGHVTERQIQQFQKALFHRALKLQIGCGAEPTLYPGLVDLVEMGKKSGIPYISLTTNGQLIASGKVDLMSLVEAGLNELTISLHGTDKDTYEYLMPGADFALLIKLIENIAQVKSKHPDFALRVNFTVNSMNVDNLSSDRFWRLWDKCTPDIIQLRPVQNIGESDWKDFDYTVIKEKYADTIGAMVEQCRQRNIRCIAPSFDQIDMVDDIQDSVSSIIEDFSYCYISPDSCYKKDFDSAIDSYESYHKRHHTSRRLLANVFGMRKSRNRKTSKKLNYRVD